MPTTPLERELQRAHGLLQGGRIEQGRQLLSILANQNYAPAMHCLANVLLIQEADDAGAQAALDLLHGAERLGDPAAAYQLAGFSLSDAGEALDWHVLARRMRLSCSARHADALCDAAVFYAHCGDPRQRAGSTALLDHAARQGSLVAMALLGERLVSGRLCEADPARGNRLRGLARQAGMPVPAPDPACAPPQAEPEQMPPFPDDFDFSRLSDAVQAPDGTVLDERIDLRLHRQALSAEECLYIQCHGGPHLRPSVSVDPNGRQHHNRIRTSADFQFLPETESVYLKLLQARMAKAAGLALKHAEALVLLRYAPGQEYRPHRDYLPPSHFVPKHAGGSGQRLRTVIAYLNTPVQGGETGFPLLGHNLPAEQGQLVRFDNLHPDGALGESSLHAGLPVIQGLKWICTLWFREAPHRRL